MMRRWVVVGCALLVMLAIAPLDAQDAVSAPNAANVRLTEVADGFSRPLYLTHAGDGSGRLFVLEQGGRIWILQDGQRLDTPFLDLTALVSTDANSFGYTERGLLGLAFAPDYATSGIFYVNYTDRSGDSVVARYRVTADANVADSASAEILLTVDQPYANHNGGHLAFGPDGYLYIGFGDGGSQGDPQGNGQRLDTPLGKILRIDVSGETGYTVPADNPFVGTPDAMPEIWAFGLRNPWRFAFDRATGDLYIGDVGGSAWEEINFQPADSAGGENYGWSLFEASQARTAAGNAGLVMPIAEYPHSEGISVTGGYVYRGERIPDLQGIYLYGDFGFGTVWAAWRDAAGAWGSAVYIANSGQVISSFGEDEAGELYIVNYSGLVMRLDPAA
ncbi:MAG: PQQ-dependent sugar dehydrogenase [Chloroflexota bacterium]|nr:PQQ-dependent sugar dehydrogenase [Chloroflexota bacterium]